MFTFEFDDAKSLLNYEKHGIDFITAQLIWNDERILEIPTYCTDEVRHLVIGTINTKHWSAVITYRSNKIRLISVRRSRKSEVELYESQSF